MARLPRLVLPNTAHLVIQRGHGDRPICADATDRTTLLAVLQRAAAAEGVRLHAWAVRPGELQLVATPDSSPALGRMMQAVGRSYVSAYNRRHGRTGTLWNGRFRCAPVEPGAPLLQVLLLVDRQTDPESTTSAGHRLGRASAPGPSDPPEFWALGNTPFERQAAYGALLERAPPDPEAQAIRRAALGGWAIGSDAFAAAVGDAAARPARPRARGRPRHAPG